jgi:serine/threonine-protein kinase HipA
MPKSEERLHVFLGEEPMGLIVRKNGKLSFTYDEGYIRNGPQIPLSLSMPILETMHDHAKVDAFLWGLLPDNDALLRKWASRYHISSSNPFGFLREIGEDCAGAIRFLRDDRLDVAYKGGKKALTQSDIERRLSDLRRDASLTREPEDLGQFSLAGAQSKTALQKIGSRWFLPWGAEPTTHILKPPRPDLAGHVENEHFCLQLARRLGLRVATSEVAKFGGETAIVVTRYDRQHSGKKIRRIHQEDTCQALGIHPANKYESAGGPGVRAIMDLLNQSNDPLEDRDRFMRAIIFNYVILGSDAHAKNYSLLLGEGQRMRLAPLYDIASLLPYASRPRDLRLAMRINRSYRDDQIRPQHFDAMARQAAYSVTKVREIIADYVEQIPRLSKELKVELNDMGIQHPILQILNERLNKRCARLSKEFRFQDNRL